MSIISEQGGAILVVDDMPRNLQLLGNILTPKGYEVLFAASGEAALERLAVREPDLILLDLMMPGMDGMEVCRRIKASPAMLDIPIVFITAANDAGNAAKALGLGAVDYIIKPFNTAELLARVRTHVALKRTRDQLHDIIRQKNELVSVVAHDLKNPLSSIRFSALMLREEGIASPDPRAELVETIVETCDHTLEFIQQSLTRNAKSIEVERLQIGRVDLLNVITQVIQENLPAAYHKDIELDVDGGDAGIFVQADPDALSRALNNLVSNAVKFSPRQRKVLLKSGTTEGGRNVCMSVIDEGPGLTAEDRQHLFKPYQRLSAQPTGGESSSGLGLSISRNLVLKMGGEIGCDSEPGRGANFWIKIPVA